MVDLDSRVHLRNQLSNLIISFFITGLQTKTSLQARDSRTRQSTEGGHSHHRGRTSNPRAQFNIRTKGSHLLLRPGKFKVHSRNKSVKIHTSISKFGFYTDPVRRTGMSLYKKLGSYNSRQIGSSVNTGNSLRSNFNTSSRKIAKSNLFQQKRADFDRLRSFHFTGKKSYISLAHDQRFIYKQHISSPQKRGEK